MSIQPRRLGKYELQQRLARGGQGEVWKAFDVQLQRFVAIKQLNANMQDDADFIARFEREAQLIASLHHPNIVRIHDFQFLPDPDTQAPVAYMIMEYIEGSTLSDYIRNTSRKRLFPTPAALLTIFTAISLALDYAHHRGMVHRDIKPANIMLDIHNPDDGPLGKPILMDFGIAKLQGGSDTTKVLGTPLYVSPEQARGLVGDSTSDLYSLGIILYEMITGVTPFRGETMMELLMRHFHDTPTPPILINPDIPQGVSDVILKSIAKEPHERFASASAMTVALAQAFGMPVPPELLKSSSLTNSQHGQVRNPISFPGIAANPVLSYETYSAQPTTPALPQTPPPVHGITPVKNSDVTEAPTVRVGFTPVQAPVAPHPVPDHTRKRPGKRLYIGLSLGLLLVLGMGVVGYLLWGTRKTSVASPVTSTPAGQVLFLTSQNSAGVLDEAQITLNGLKNAPINKNYYVWLNIHDENAVAVHWMLNVQDGKLTTPTYMEPQHQDLFAQSPYLFLITLQGPDATVASFDPNDHLYYAVIPQTQSPSDHLTVMNHLNHLLTSDPNLEKLGLHNGLRYWLMTNTKALIQESNGASTAYQNKQAPSLRQHLVDMLYYLRGTSCAPSDLQNAPQGTPTKPDGTTAVDAKISLLDCSQNTVLPGLLTHTELHVRSIIQAPGATPTQIKLSPQLQTNLAQVRGWLTQYQKDVMYLLTLSDNQLLQPSTQSYFNDIKTLNNEISNGPTPSSKLGIVQMSKDLQDLATFDIMSCASPSGSKICNS